MLPLRTALAFFLWLISSTAHAQEFIGFDRTSFGKVILSQKQSTAWINDIRLELANGAYNNEPIQNYSATSVFARMGRSVGRLDVLTDKGVFPCTAFVVSDRYLLTNYHCVPGILDDDRVKALRIEAVNFVAGYVQEGVTQGTRPFNVNPVPVEADLSLDYAVLEVFGDPSAEFGKLELSDHLPASGDPYWVIGHPMGEAQRISREKCKANDPAIDNKRLLHTCDTLPGNSGSPLIDASLQKVVGLHHAGSHTNSVNYAIPMADILKQSNVLKVALPDQPAVVAVAPQSDPCDPQFALAKQVNQCAVWDGYLASCPSHSKASEARRLQGSACAADSCDAVFRGARASNTCDSWKSYTKACSNHSGIVVAEMAVELACKPIAEEKPAEKPKQAASASKPSEETVAGWVKSGDEASGRNDYKQAAEFYRNAADAGDPCAQLRLGVVYEFGRGLTSSTSSAVYWYQKAVAQNGKCFGAAKYSLDRLSKTAAAPKTSTSRPKGADIAEWVKKARQANIQKKYDEALQLYRMAANAGDQCAQFQLGVMYEFGRGVAASQKSAINWYRLAVSYDGSCYETAKASLERLTGTSTTGDKLASQPRPVARPAGLLPNTAEVAGKPRFNPSDREDVVFLQRLLNKLGCRAGAEDGVWGAKTKSAAQLFAVTSGLEFDVNQVSQNYMESLQSDKAIKCPPAEHSASPLATPVTKIVTGVAQVEITDCGKENYVGAIVKVDHVKSTSKHNYFELSHMNNWPNATNIFNSGTLVISRDSEVSGSNVKQFQALGNIKYNQKSIYSFKGLLKIFPIDQCTRRVFNKGKWECEQNEAIQYQIQGTASDHCRFFMFKRR